jgi:opacity protein-like surface antigen
MRRLLIAGIIAVVAHGAQAADAPDVPILRGAVYEAPKVKRALWQGFYVGAQAGYGASNIDFVGLSETNWPGLAQATHRATSIGGFAGYNAQFEDVIVGIEGNYSHGTFTGSAFNTSTETFLNVGPLPGLDRTVVMRSDGSMAIKDFGSVRIRGGYIAGNFLPYAFVGLGFGRADTFRSNTITGTYTGTTGLNGVSGVPRVTTLAYDTNNQFVHGVSGGVGLDWMLFGGLFVRAEYEYLQFTSSIDTNIHTVRGGVGYKF